jgi:hypothetical protein
MGSRLDMGKRGLIAMNYRLTLKSSNKKTGPIPVSTTSSSSCPPTCPFKGNGCYAEQQPLKGRWLEVDRGEHSTDLDGFCAKIAALPEGTLWRHNQAGDSPGEGDALDAEALGELVSANKGKRGFTYTHKPLGNADRAAIASANASGFTINLSGNNLTHADELADMAIAPVVTVLPIEYARREQRIGKAVQWAESLDEYRARVAALPQETPAGRAVRACPATYLDTDCANCGLCARQNRKVIVGFPAHGSAKTKADVIATQE